MERFDETKSHKELLSDLVELVQLAEAGGFTTVWIGEHHAMEFTIAPNPLNYLAYLTPLTKTIRLGAGTFVAPFWDPIRMAGESAMVDVMSDGRLEIGIARGAYQFEFDRMAKGMDASTGGKYLRELVPAVQKLWQGDYAHDGECYSFPMSTSVPKPIQNEPHPPLWIAARDPDSHNFAVSNGCNVMVTPLAKGDQEVSDLMDKFNTALSNNPDVDRPKIMALQHAYICEDESGCEFGARAIRRWYANFSAFFRNDQDPVNGFCKEVPDEEMAQVPGFDLKSLSKNMMIGTPEMVIPRLKKYEEIGIDEYSFWTDNSMSHEDKKRSLELFINKVMPAFK
tara:strand:- start:29229 stop:30245 length:1017 start_codon:yes stop_codon:yes gene_type:complete